MSNVLDLSMPSYVIEEDKSRQTHVVIKKNTRNVNAESPEKAARPGDQVVEKVEEAQVSKSPYDPFEDELEQQFYTDLPDFRRFFEAMQTSMDQFSDEQIVEAANKAESQFDDLTTKLVKS